MTQYTYWSSLGKVLNLIKNSDSTCFLLLDSSIDGHYNFLRWCVVLGTANSDLCTSLLNELLDKTTTCTDDLCDQVVWDQQSKRYFLIVSL